MSPRALQTLQVIATIVILALAVYVVLNPALAYARTPRVVLAVLVAVLVAILFGLAATSSLKLKLPGFVFMTTGAAALCLGAFVMIMRYMAPTDQVIVYSLQDGGDPFDAEYTLNEQHLMRVESAANVPATAYLRRNQVAVLFPEQVPAVTLWIRKRSDGPWFKAKLSYTQVPTRVLRFGHELQQDQAP